MNKRTFSAHSWLGAFGVDARSEENFLQEGAHKTANQNAAFQNQSLVEEIESNRQQVTRSHLPDFSPRYLKEQTRELNGANEQSFNPLNHLIRGWDGGSLPSKGIEKFKKVIASIAIDAKVKLLSQSGFNRSLKQQIFEEFLLYCNSKSLVFEHIDTPAKLWAMFSNILKDEEQNQCSEYEHLNEFSNIFSFRVATIYFLKIKFIYKLAASQDKIINVNTVINPNSYITKIFRKGSSNELHSKSFKQNIFNWYRPDNSQAANLLEFLKSNEQQSIKEIIKHTSYVTQLDNKEKPLYAHALSHQNFGLFLNGLLINIPLWLEASRKSQNDIPLYGQKSDHNIISCKFVGDYLESLAVSHWLAQDNNKHFRWDELLCPQFKGNSFENGVFFELFNELQFLNFNLELATLHGLETVSFLGQTMKRNLRNRKESDEVQNTFWGLEQNERASTYNRVILNLSHFPKKNPNHYLYQQILDQKSSLKAGGYLVVLSSKKLFVDSLKNKVDNILKHFSIECCMSLDKVKGKGACPSYIYIIKKKTIQEIGKSHGKQYCMSFRISGTLESFYDFHEISSFLFQFLGSTISHRPIMYSRKFFQGFLLEFYQDAIVKGRLIRSTKKDSSSITHPKFFQNLLSSSVTFDQFFEIESLNTELDVAFKKDGLGINSNFGVDLVNQHTHPFVCIIDKREIQNIRIELIEASAFSAKLHQYGISQCHYFGIRPKLIDLNPAIFKEYFESRIGKQITHITFENLHSSYKRQLRSLLIPKFFLDNKDIPSHIVSGLSVFSLDRERIQALAYDKLKESFGQAMRFAPTLIKSYPVKTFELVSYFKNTLKYLTDTSSQNSDLSNYFNSDFVKKSLVNLNTQCLYPQNPEIYVNFNIEQLDSLKTPMSEIKANCIDDLYQISIFGNQGQLLTIHCKKHTGELLKFILSNLKGHQVYDILSGLQVPNENDLQSLKLSFGRSTQVYSEIYQQCKNFISNTLTELINRPQ